MLMIHLSQIIVHRVYIHVPFLNCEIKALTMTCQPDDWRTVIKVNTLAEILSHWSTMTNQTRPTLELSMIQEDTPVILCTKDDATIRFPLDTPITIQCPLAQ